MGHTSDGILSDPSGALFIKPCTPAEVSFYESALASHPDFAAFMPTFMGTLKLGDPSKEPLPVLESTAVADAARVIAGGVATGEAVDDDTSMLANDGAATQTPSDDVGPLRGKRLTTDLAIVLENTTSGFVRPNVLDLKLGSQLWDSSASPAKRARLDKVASETTSSSLGFRIAGMKVWQGGGGGGGSTSNKDTDTAIDGGTEGYRIFDKLYGRAFTADNVSKGFKEFLSIRGTRKDRDLRHIMAGRLTADVKRIRQVLEREESRMYGASILIVYEGDAASLEKALELEEQARIEAEQAKATARVDKSRSAPRSPGSVLAQQPTSHSSEVRTGQEQDNIHYEEHHDDDKDDGLDEEAEVNHEEEERGVIVEQDEGGDNDDVDDDHDDDDEEEEEESSLPKAHEVHLIDFAHATWTPGLGPDENVLKGVRNVERILEEF